MDKFRKIFCVLFRHSNIETNCMGYILCGRCGEQMGDVIAGAYKNPRNVGEFCGCEECKINYAQLTWLDFFLVPKHILKNTRESLVVDREKERRETWKKLKESVRKN